ncbi:MAG: tetratricopeptide repeat protein [Prevotella sp.]|nr:tetratricopeptide repeat protein [Prevotella sp.]
MKHLLTIIILLLALNCCTTESSRNRMRAGLDSINQRNRNDQPFTVADVEPYVSFFDAHGTPNDRLLAHYLLGRAYYEVGEAPIALECYQKAAECADTANKDCDYPQLSRVYAQMAQIFYEQGLYREQLVFQRLSSKQAWTGKDTLAALLSYEQESQAYRNLNMPDSSLYVCENVYSLYREYGYNNYAARTLGYTLRELINRNDLDKARKNMQIYESESGFFDSIGNIQKGREIYYRIKGLYFLHKDNLDSAEYYFRKELRDGKDFNNQNAGAMGMATLYQRLHRPDSASIYFEYAYAMNDSMYAQKATKEIENIQAMYNYTRHQNIANQEQKKANHRTIIIWICIGIIIIVCLLTFIISREMTRKRKVAEQKYLQSQSVIEQAQSDIVKLRKNAETNRELISEKEQIIREQETILMSLLQRDTQSKTLADKRLKLTVIFGKFEQLSVIGQKPTNVEWEQMEDQLFKYYPGFKDFMSRHTRLLNDKEYKTCLLIRLGFKPKMVSNMLEVDPSYITNIRTEMTQKLFNLSGSSKVFDKMLREIY